jgi:hypothetical protein
MARGRTPVSSDYSSTATRTSHPEDHGVVLAAAGAALVIEVEHVGVSLQGDYGVTGRLP